MTGRALTRLAIAWRGGGAGGVAALTDPWSPPAEDLDEAVAALRAADLPGRVRVQGERVSRGGVQLRLGRDGQWYRFRRAGDGCDLDGPPSPDPAILADPR